MQTRASNDSTPRLSIILPCYNVEKFLDRCLASILSQDFSDFELLAVDDGSTDSTGAILASWAQRDGRLRVHTQPNAGQSAARNHAIGLARAPWLMFVDADDYLETRSIETLFRAQAESQADVVAGRIKLVTTDGEDIKWISQHPSGQMDSRQALWCILNFHKLHNYVFAKIFRRELFGQDFFPRGMMMEDVASMHRIYARMGKMCFVPDRVYNYVDNPAGTMNNATHSVRRDLDFIKACFIRYEFAQQSDKLSPRQKRFFRYKTIKRIGRVIPQCYDAEPTEAQREQLALDHARLEQIAGRTLTMEDLRHIRRRMLLPTIRTKIALLFG